VDRAKEMIITGGFNVYSAEVEQALLEHPGIPPASTSPVTTSAHSSNPPAASRPPSRSRYGRTCLAPKVGKILKNEVKSRLLSQPGRDSR
jgi:fatty-acyl-CoA synthase